MNNHLSMLSISLPNITRVSFFLSNSNLGFTKLYYFKHKFCVISLINFQNKLRALVLLSWKMHVNMWDNSNFLLVFNTYLSLTYPCPNRQLSLEYLLPEEKITSLGLADNSSFYTQVLEISIIDSVKKDFSTFSHGIPCQTMSTFLFSNWYKHRIHSCTVWAPTV